MPGVTHRRGGPRTGVELSAKPVQNPPEGSVESSPVVASVTSEDDSNKRIRTALIIGAVVSIAWMFFVTARNLPDIYFIAVPIIAIIGVVGFVVNVRHQEREVQPAQTSEKANVQRRVNPTISVKHGGLLPSGFRGWRLRRNSLWLSSSEELSPRDLATYNRFWAQREQEAIERVEVNEPERHINRLQHLANSGVTGIIDVEVGKSVGKSRTTQVLAATLRHYTGRITDTMTSTANTSTSTLNGMSDIQPENRKDIVWFSREVKKAKTPREIRELVPLTDQDHVGVIGEYESRDITRVQYGTVAFLTSALRLMLTDEYCILDGGNDNIEKDGIRQWAARIAHCQVFVYKPDDAPVIRNMRSDVNVYRADTDSGSKHPEIQTALIGRLDDELITEQTLGLTGINISTPEKVALSVVVAVKADSVDQESVEKYMSPVPRSPGDQPSADVWNGQCVSISSEPRFLGTRPGTDMPEPNPCIWEELSPETQEDGVRLAVAVLEQIAVARELEVSDTYKFKPAIVIDES